MNNVYLMLSPKKPWRVKIGVSNKTKRRAKQVQAFAICALPMFYAYWVESSLHRAYRPLHAKERKSDGSTEWFYIFNIGTACVTFIFLPEYPGAAIFAALAPLPFDCLLFLLLIFCVQWSAVFACFYAIFCVFSGFFGY